MVTEETLNLIARMQASPVSDQQAAAALITDLLVTFNPTDLRRAQYALTYWQERRAHPHDSIKSILDRTAGIYKVDPSTIRRAVDRASKVAKSADSATAPLQSLPIMAAS